VDYPRLAFRQLADPHVFRIVRRLFFSSGQFRGRLLPDGRDSGSDQLIVSIFDSLTKFNLTAIPFFILMGEVLYHAGLVSKALDVFFQVGRRHSGRLSIVTFLIGGSLRPSVEPPWRALRFWLP